MSIELLNTAKEGDLRKFIELSRKANIHHTDSQGNNVLHLAALHGKHQIAQYIVQHHSGLINSLNNSHNTPLHLATEGGSKEIVSLLLQNNAKVDAPNKAGFNFFLFAFYGCETSLEMLDYLISLPRAQVSLKEKQTVVGDYHFETLYQKLKKVAGQGENLKKTQEKLELSSFKPKEDLIEKEDIIFEKLYKTERELQRSDIRTGSDSFFSGFTSVREKHKSAFPHEPIPALATPGKEKEELQQALLMSRHSFVEIPRLSELMFEKLKSRKMQDFGKDVEGYSRAEDQIRRYLQIKEDYSIKEDDYASIIVQAIIEESQQELKKEMEAEVLLLKDGQKSSKSEAPSQGLEKKPIVNGTKGSILGLQLQRQASSDKLKNGKRDSLVERDTRVEENVLIDSDGLEKKETRKQQTKKFT